MVMGQYNIRLAADAHYQRVIESLEPGAPIKLTADADNPRDPRAVKATHHGETIGYVEQDSWLIRAMHDDRTLVASRVHEIVEGGTDGAKCVVLDVRTGADAEAALGRLQAAGTSPLHAANKKRGCFFWGAVAVAGLVGFVILAIAVGPSKEQIAARKSQEALDAGESATSVTAMELWQAYEQNEAAAQQAYGNRPLRITGKVKSIQLGFSDEPYVVMETGNMFQSVQLHFADPSDGSIASLRKGDVVSAICTDISEVVGSPILKGCALQ